MELPVTYESLKEKYPLAKADIEELQRQKNKALKFVIFGVFLISISLGYWIGGMLA